MRAVGSQGKHTLVAMMSFGCNVTGVLTCRIIENTENRILGIITSPLILCNGRFGAGLVLIILFFGRHVLPVALVNLDVSVGAMLLATWVLNRFFFRREPSGFCYGITALSYTQVGQGQQAHTGSSGMHTMGRAVLIAAPAILLIWLLGNLPPGVPFERTAVGHLVGVAVFFYLR